MGESERTLSVRAAAVPLADYFTPALVIDLDVVEANITALVTRIGLERWRPHIKTVKQARVLACLLEAGVRRFKCATLTELALLTGVVTKQQLRAHVLLAYPLPVGPASEAAALVRGSGLSLTLLADDAAHAQELASLVAPGVTLAIDVDLGMARTGQPPSHWMAAAPILARHLPAKSIGVIHGYDGHVHVSEEAHGAELDASQRSLTAANAGYDGLVRLAQAFSTLDGLAGDAEILTSGSHSFELALDHAGLQASSTVHRVSPGTLVLSDLRSEPRASQLGIRYAARVLSTVVSVSEGRFTLDAGSKALSPDVPAPNCSVVGLALALPQRPSEEHLPVFFSSPDPEAQSIASDRESDAAPRRGERLWLIPAHICTTVNLHQRVIYVRGDKVETVGRVEAAGHPLTPDDLRQTDLMPHLK